MLRVALVGPYRRGQTAFYSLAKWACMKITHYLPKITEPPIKISQASQAVVGGGKIHVAKRTVPQEILKSSTLQVATTSSLDLNELKRIKVASTPPQQPVAKLFLSGKARSDAVSNLPIDQVTAAEHKVLKATLEILAKDPSSAKNLRLVDALPYKEIMITTHPLKDDKLSIFKEEYVGAIGTPENKTAMLVLDKELVNSSEPHMANLRLGEVYDMLLRLAAPIQVGVTAPAELLDVGGEKIDLATEFFVQREQDTFWRARGEEGIGEEILLDDLQEKMMGTGQWNASNRNLLIKHASPELHPLIHSLMDAPKEIKIGETSRSLSEWIGELVLRENKNPDQKQMIVVGDESMSAREILAGIQSAVARGELTLEEVSRAVQSEIEESGHDLGYVVLGVALGEQ